MCFILSHSWQVKNLVVVDLDTDEILYKNFPAGSQYGIHVPSVPQQAVEEFKERYVTYEYAIYYFLRQKVLRPGDVLYFNKIIVIAYKYVLYLNIL